MNPTGVHKPIDQTAMVTDYRSGVSVKSICSKYGVSNTIIYKILKKRGIERRDPYQHIRSAILVDYKSGLNTRMVAHKYRISQIKINKIISDAGESLRYKRFDIDPSVLDTMNEYMAYFLGLFCADGHIDTRYSRIGITLHKQDSYILEALCRWLKLERPLTYVKNVAILGINNKDVCAKFCVLGLGDKKHFRISVPKSIPTHLLHHFVRGVFDGDGTISSGNGMLRFDICGYENFMQEIASIIFNQTGIFVPYYFRHITKKGSNFGNILKSSTDATIAIYKWLYKDATIKMERKYERYIQYVEQLKNKRLAKQVYLVDDSGMVMNTFKNARQAGYALNVDDGDLGKVLHGKRSSVKGMKFRYSIPRIV